MSAEPIDFGSAPTVAAQEGWTVADVDALPDRDGVRYELVDGVPHVMTPPRIEHQNALLELHLALRATAPPGLRVVQGVGVLLAEDQRPIPDLVVVGTADRTLFNIPADEVVVAAEVVYPHRARTTGSASPPYRPRPASPATCAWSWTLRTSSGTGSGPTASTRRPAAPKPGLCSRSPSPSRSRSTPRLSSVRRLRQPFHSLRRSRESSPRSPRSRGAAAGRGCARRAPSRPPATRP